MVLSDQLSPETLVHSLEAGRFYASTGVTLEEVTSTPAIMPRISVRPDADTTYRNRLYRHRGKDFDRTSEPVLDKNGNELMVRHGVTRQKSDEILKSEWWRFGFSYEFHG